MNLTVRRITFLYRGCGLERSTDTTTVFCILSETTRPTSLRRRCRYSGSCLPAAGGTLCRYRRGQGLVLGGLVTPCDGSHYVSDLPGNRGNHAADLIGHGGYHFADFFGHRCDYFANLAGHAGERTTDLLGYGVSLFCSSLLSAI